MKKTKNNKAIIAVVAIIVIALIVLCVLFATGTLSFKENKTDDATKDKVDVSLVMEKVTVSKNSSNSKILVSGTMELSYDDSKYAGVLLSGYCLGSNGEKYIIEGPADGSALFHKDGKSLSLAENTSEKVVTADGTTTAWKDIKWKNVKIKYCKIDKMTAVLNEGTENPETVLNVEKNFN